MPRVSCSLLGAASGMTVIAGLPLGTAPARADSASPLPHPAQFYRQGPDHDTQYRPELFATGTGADGQELHRVA